MFLVKDKKKAGETSTESNHRQWWWGL